MFKWFFKLLRFSSDRGLQSRVQEINALEAEIKAMSDGGLKEESLELQNQIRNIGMSDVQKIDVNFGTSDIQKLIAKKLDELLPRAFALVREAAWRTLKQRHFDVQLMGGIVLHQGRIAEMMTGEGKTLASTAPAYLNALTGNGVHIVTVNEYLAKRDTVWMGQIYHFLGLKVACLVHEGALLYDSTYTNKRTSNILRVDVNFGISDVQKLNKESALLDKERDTTGGFLVQDEYLRPISRKEAYQADITYGTNHEFGFDYLRDNLAHGAEQQSQKHPLNYAIIDEVDSILIDEARTPLIISAPDAESSQFYKTFARIASRLEPEKDYLVDEKLRSADITQEGIDKVEQSLGIKNLYAPENLRMTHYLQESLKAGALFQKDRDYVVKDGEVIIVDQFTGRLMLGRRYSGGLHQAIEAKEGMSVKQESRTYAQISIQNYFRLYKKLAGMTGTAQTSAEEFDKVYGLEAASIPPNRLMVRQDAPDLVYKTLDGKYEAVARDIKERYERGQPVLVGTVSIEKNEHLSRLLKRAGVPHEVLNAKNNEREGATIAQAGKLKAVTVATNMAGRGVDIIIGGNPPDILEAQKVKDLGGLHVIGTERHESRRIDNQLRGRSGRQGDPGSSQFFLSLEDDLMRVFGGEKIKKMMEFLKIPEDTPIESRAVSRSLRQAQGRIEGMNFDARKHLLDYDDVLNKQRLAFYKMRQEILESKMLNVKSDKGNEMDSTEDKIVSEVKISLSHVALDMSLGMLDMFWMDHLENMEAFAESVRLRAYGQHDPLVEYRREGHLLFQQMMAGFEQWVFDNSDKLKGTSDMGLQNVKNDARQGGVPLSMSHSAFNNTKVGRNDPCPCGSEKKYKRCHGN